MFDLSESLSEFVLISGEARKVNQVHTLAPKMLIIIITSKKTVTLQPRSISSTSLDQYVDTSAQVVVKEAICIADVYLHPSAVYLYVWYLSLTNM